MKKTKLTVKKLSENRVLVHTGAMLLVMGTVAIAVYQWIGLQILRSAWINLDTIWAVALIAAGILSLII